jgi:hypothetical protein
MTDITLTHLEVRTGNTTDWLYLRAITNDPYGIPGRIWALVTLEGEHNYGIPQTLFDPDSDCDVDYMGATRATGSLLLDCGCSRQLVYLGSTEGADHVELNIGTLTTTVPEWTSVCCHKHRNFDHEWSTNPDPLLHLRAILSLEEIASIRAGVLARRDGVSPMSLAGLFGAAGVDASETEFADDPDSVDTLFAMAALRGGVSPQSDGAWFRVR